jgi:hypothetical protein
MNLLHISIYPEQWFILSKNIKKDNLFNAKKLEYSYVKMLGGGDKLGLFRKKSPKNRNKNVGPFLQAFS